MSSSSGAAPLSALTACTQASLHAQQRQQFQAQQKAKEEGAARRVSNQIEGLFKRKQARTALARPRTGLGSRPAPAPPGLVHGGPRRPALGWHGSRLPAPVATAACRGTPMRTLPTRLLGRLKVSRKLMLIYLLDLSAVIYVSGVLINEKYLAINFARKEVLGNAYAEAVRDTLLDLGRLAAGQALGEDVLAQRAQGLAQAERDLGPGLATHALNEAWRARLAALPLQSPGQLAQALPGVMAEGRALMTRIGNQSNLILDPDLDSYYTMSLSLMRHPELAELIAALGRELTLARERRQAASVDDRTRFLLLEGRIDALAEATRQDLNEAITASDPALGRALRPAHEALQHQVEQLRSLARAMVDGATDDASLSRVAQARLHALQALSVAWSASHQQLDRLLHERIDRLFQRMWLHLGTALALLLGILVLVTLVARAIARPLGHLADVVDTVRRTGDHALRAEGNSQDEIGRLIVAFNEMLGQLHVERERQKELAASARAAEAQRALVASTPIALVVTAVPGHEVLHANPPAEHWLAGRDADPWATGLDAMSRARFFQQLADRGAVDEFEVRWHHPRGSDWAVLSARLVTFDGQRSVLTAFTPINHLKVMERRLELWAKVFETSSEGIVILDAQQQVLTINRAMTRTSGLDLGEVLGHPPAELFFDEDACRQLPAVWQQVARRGSWSGELRMRRRDGHTYPAWVMVSGVRQGEGPPSHTIIVSMDITDRKESEARIRFLAEHDVLTQLPNRALCTERLRLAMQQARRRGDKVAVIFLDLDHFKDINDSLGHHVGDGLLRSVAARLSSAVRDGDTVSRLGGDEFVVVLSQVQGPEEVAHVVEERLIPGIRQPHRVEGEELSVSGSVGIALFPDDSEDLETLMRHADTAMYQAKACGRDGAQFFTAEMTARAQHRLQLEADLRRAVELQQFVLHWQPRVEARSGRLCGVEGLLRWAHPQRGLVSPAEFITLAEETRLIVPLGRWVIDEACRQAAVWRRQGLPDFGVSVNLSPLQLRDAQLADGVAAALERHGVRQGQLELELTESMVMNDAEAHLHQMHALRALGVALAIDDFGTGYSSLAYLTRLPLDQIGRAHV